MKGLEKTHEVLKSDCAKRKLIFGESNKVFSTRNLGKQEHLNLTISYENHKAFISLACPHIGCSVRNSKSSVVLVRGSTISEVRNCINTYKKKCCSDNLIGVFTDLKVYHIISGTYNLVVGIKSDEIVFLFSVRTVLGIISEIEVSEKILYSASILSFNVKTNSNTNYNVALNCTDYSLLV